MEQSKRGRKAAVAAVVLPCVLCVLAASTMSRLFRGQVYSPHLAMSSAPICGDVLLFTSQRHGSNHIIEEVNNCHNSEGAEYTRTFEFPHFSVPNINKLNLTTYDSFYSYYKTQPKYSYKIMSTVFYQFYYHVDSFVSQLKGNEKFTYVLLRRRNTVEVYYSHLEHLRQQRVAPEDRLTTSAEFRHADTTIVGRKKDSLYTSEWSPKQYEHYRETLLQFYRDVHDFAAQKLLPLDELYYEDIVVNPLTGADTNSIYLPANKCVLKLCHGDSAQQTFKNERM